MSSRCACGLPGDPPQWLWAFVWFPYALLHGMSLMHTTMMWAPVGMNLGGATAAPMLAFVLSPITWLWGPIAALNVMTIALPVATGWSAFWLCKYLTKHTWASILGGAAFGFSTMVTAQYSHLQVSFLVCPPLIVLATLRFIDGRSSSRRFGVEMTALLFVQLLIGTEVLFTLSVMGVIALLFTWLVGDRGQKASVCQAARVIAAAYAATAVLGSWYLYAELTAPEYAKGLGILYPTDLLTFATPTPFTWIGGHTFQPVTDLMQGNPSEMDAFIGLPMIAVLIRFIGTRWSRFSTRLITLLLAVTVVWIVGPTLWIAGKATISMPYALVAHLPVFNQVMQGRVAAYLALLCAVVLAMWLASSRRFVVARWLVGVLAVVCLLPNLASPGPAASWHNPRFFTAGLYKRYLTRNEIVLPLPWAGSGFSMLWQAETHMYFRMAGGYFLIAPEGSWRSRLTNDLWVDVVERNLGSEMRTLLGQRRVSDVVVDDAIGRQWEPALVAAGLRAGPDVGGITLYRVPKSWWIRTPPGEV